ncbi:MAG: fused MFS/spermidine synthase [Trichloromonadaceae bacterium]
MPLSSPMKALIYLIFATSGFCALVYEILWTKHLSLIFGTTLVAVSLVAATFMGGLALGSWLFGRHVDRGCRLLHLYALLEVGIAVTALLFTPTLALVQRFYHWLSISFPEQVGLITGFQFLLVALLILPPTLCMGGTFPLMCRFFARRKSGGQIGRLYALNTLGAALGAFCAAYLLIPNLGMTWTGYLAVFGNLLVALAAWLLGRKQGQQDSDGATIVPPSDPFLQPERHRLAMISIGLVGFFALAYEILWTRVLLLFLGNTSYAFALILSSYLIGLALGGALYARLVRPQLQERRLFVLLTTLLALVILITAPFYDHLAHLFQFAHDASGERWWHLSLLSALVVFCVIALPTMLSGALLPAAVAIVDPGKNHTGEGVGMVVLHNTVGAMFGSLAAGFLLIPWLGLQGSFTLLAAANLLVALALCIRYQCWAWRRYCLPALMALGLVLVVAHRDWNPVLLTSGVYVYAPKYRMLGGIEKTLGQDRLLALYEGADSTVGVHETAGGKSRYFTVNGKTDGGTGADMKTQILVGQLPLLLHPDPQQVFVLGLGTGISLGGVVRHPVKEIDCAEISPEVVKAEAHFTEFNGNPLRDPRVQLAIRDGRHQLLTGTKQYDIIVSQPSNPWQSGNANLFTSEFYRMSAARLKPGGLFSQWIGLYDITPENLKVASRTFLETFPYVLVFKESTDLLLIGSKTPLDIDFKRLEARLMQPKVRSLLASVGLHTAGELIANHYLFCNLCLSRFAAGAVINSDRQPILEYSAHHNLGMKALGMFAQENMQALLGAMQREVIPLVNLGQTPAEAAQALRSLGTGFRRAGREAEARLFIGEAERLADR